MASYGPVTPACGTTTVSIWAGVMTPMHGMLLDDAVDGGDEILELRSPLGLDLVLGDAGGFLLGFRQLV